MAGQKTATHKLTVEGFAVYEIESGKKLVLALEQNGVDVSHRCGGQALCTTCRVRFLSKEPEMRFDEKNRLTEEGDLGKHRLSCQIRVNEDMHVEVLMRASDEGWDPGVEVEP